jgi:hypothetical protein
MLAGLMSCYFFKWISSLSRLLTFVQILFKSMVICTWSFGWILIDYKDLYFKLRYKLTEEFN